MSKEIHFEHGGLYRLKEDLFIAYQDYGKKSGDLSMIRKMIIPAGEILEFRYYSPAHFRDRFSHYFPVHESQYNKFEYVGQILEEVRFNNIAKLDEILRLRLYKRTDGEYGQLLPLQPDNLEKHFEGVHTKL